MKLTTISKTGRVSIPAEVRHRWGTRSVLIEDQGGSLLIRPISADPIAAAIGSLKGVGPSTDQMRAELRGEEEERDEQKWGGP